MIKLILMFSFLAGSSEALACSYCKKSAAAGDAAAAAVAANNPTSTLSGGGGGPVRVIAAKPAIDMNAPIILGDYSAGPEQTGLRKGNTEDFEIPTNEIFGN